MVQNSRPLTYAIVALALLSGLTFSAAAQQLTSGIDTSNFDHSVRPQDDFYRYVNGGWLKKAQIPADASSWGAFQELRENSRNALHQLFEEASTSNAKSGSPERKVGDLYASYMDSARVEQLGTKPLAPELKVIASLKSPAQLPSTFAHFARLGINGPIGVFVSADAKHSNDNIVQVTQSGLGLPDRDYYLKQDAKMASARAAYVAYITQLLTLAKQPDPAGAANRILALETEIATPQWDRARNRDRNATYNKMTVAELAAMTPSYNWKSYLSAAGLGEGERRRRAAAGLPQVAGSDLREDARVHVARVSHLPSARRLRRRAACGVRAGALRVSRQDAQRPAGARDALEARGRRHRTPISAKPRARSTSRSTSSRRRRRGWMRW